VGLNICVQLPLKNRYFELQVAGFRASRGLIPHALQLVTCNFHLPFPETKTTAAKSKSLIQRVGSAGLNTFAFYYLFEVNIV